MIIAMFIYFKNSYYDIYFCLIFISFKMRPFGHRKKKWTEYEGKLKVKAPKFFL